MFPLALAFVLAAAPPRPPVAPKTAPLAVQVKSPRTGLPELRGFLTEAGAWSAAARPYELGRSLGTMLGADLLDAASMEEAGVDLDSPLTVSFLDEASVVCLTAAKGGKALERARATMAGAGPVTKQVFKGVPLEGVAAGKLWRAGFATKGSALCLASGGSDALAALKVAVDALSGAGLATTSAYKAAAGLDAPVMGFFQGAQMSGALEIHAALTTLKVVGRANLKQSWLDKPKDGDLLAGFAPEAAMAMHLTLTPATLADPAGPAAGALGFLMSNACKGCDAALAKGLLDSIRPLLTGSVGLVVKSIDPTAATENMSRYFLVSHAYLLPVKDEAAARKALEAGIDKVKARGAKVVTVETPDGAQWTVALGARVVWVGVAHGALFVANEVAARDLALAALAGAKPGKEAHAGVFHVNGPLATAALRKISVLEVTKSQELASLFALGVEMGTLLKAAGPIEGFAEPEANGIRFEGGFTLKPSR